MKEWKFADPPNVAVLSDKSIFKSGHWIAYVSHMEDDGSWLFDNRDNRNWEEAKIMLVGLQDVVRIDESIMELADLPEGWHAWRSSKSSPWQRAKSRPVAFNDNE